MTETKSGQIVVNSGTNRKLTKGEVNYRPDGIERYMCGDCRWYTSGRCEIVEGKIEPEYVCDEFEPNLVDGSMSASEANVQRVDLYITRVAENPQTGQRRWYATASGVKWDKYQERMTVDLFKDFIRRAEAHDLPPLQFTSKSWNGGLPYLGLAHYLDLNGFGIVGPTDRIWIDGSTFKAKGTFADTPLADATYLAIKRDIDNDVPQDERVRISIAFVDWAHEHLGHGMFTRRSLEEACSLCAQGIGQKVYRAGHLIHMACTRRPAYIETEISLEERSMSHKRDDAASIVGDELADELEQRNQRLVGRSAPAVAPGALVIKGKKSPEEKPPMDEDEMEGEEMDEDEEEMSYRSRLGGATTLDAAESFLQKSQQSPLMDSWSLLADVLANVAATTSSGDLPTVIRATVGDFQKRLDVLALRAIVDVNRLLKGGTPMSEAKPNTQAPEPHVLDESIAALKSAFDDALANHASITERGEVIQPALEQLAQAIRTGVEVPADGNFNMTELAGVIKSAVAETVAPLQSQVHALMQRSATNGGHVQVDTGQRRAIQLAPLQERGAPVLTAGDGKTPKLREIINRSVRQ